MQVRHILCVLSLVEFSQFSLVSLVSLLQSSQVIISTRPAEMDPLSVMASVAGLLGAAGKVISVLAAVKRIISDAPKSLELALSQIRELEFTLAAVQSFLLGISSASRERTSLIRVNQLIATL